MWSVDWSFYFETGSCLGGKTLMWQMTQRFHFPHNGPFTYMFGSISLKGKYSGKNEHLWAGLKAAEGHPRMLEQDDAQIELSQRLKKYSSFFFHFFLSFFLSGFPRQRWGPTTTSCQGQDLTGGASTHVRLFLLFGKSTGNYDVIVIRNKHLDFSIKTLPWQNMS